MQVNMRSIETSIPVNGNNKSTAKRLQRSASLCASTPLVLSLPSDALYCVASFLTPSDWRSFSVCNKSSRRAAHAVFRRVRLHGFRCAQEIVTSWVLGEHSDALELARLYISHGVPIHPLINHSSSTSSSSGSNRNGHSVLRSTLEWRMSVESNEMQSRLMNVTSGDDSATNRAETERTPAPPAHLQERNGEGHVTFAASAESHVTMVAGEENDPSLGSRSSAVNQFSTTLSPSRNGQDPSQNQEQSLQQDIIDPFFREWNPVLGDPLHNQLPHNQMAQQNLHNAALNFNLHRGPNANDNALAALGIATSSSSGENGADRPISYLESKCYFHARHGYKYVNGVNGLNLSNSSSAMFPPPNDFAGLNNNTNIRQNLDFFNRPGGYGAAFDNGFNNNFHGPVPTAYAGRLNAASTMSPPSASTNPNGGGAATLQIRIHKHLHNQHRMKRPPAGTTYLDDPNLDGLPRNVAAALQAAEEEHEDVWEALGREHNNLDLMPLPLPRGEEHAVGLDGNDTDNNDEETDDDENGPTRNGVLRRRRHQYLHRDTQHGSGRGGTDTDVEDDLEGGTSGLNSRVTFRSSKNACVSLSADFFHPQKYSLSVAASAHGSTGSVAEIDDTIPILHNLNIDVSVRHRHNLQNSGKVRPPGFITPDIYCSLSCCGDVSSAFKDETTVSADVLATSSQTNIYRIPRQLRKHLYSRFRHYQHRLECHADSCLLNDSPHLRSQYNEYVFDETLCDFWDEFFPSTAGIMRHDGFTAIPRASCMHKFLTNPCPKSIGIVQCEIERIRCTSKGKRRSSQGGLKGRLFPSYEYRLFIRDRTNLNNSSEGDADDGNSSQHDMVLMTARNRGKKHQNSYNISPKKTKQKRGANNYYLYMATADDNPRVSPFAFTPNNYNAFGSKGCDFKHLHTSSFPSPYSTHSHESLMRHSQQPFVAGRLQSNFIGTEFQIFSPRDLNSSIAPSASDCLLDCNALSCGADEYDDDIMSDSFSITSPMSHPAPQSKRSVSAPNSRSAEVLSLSSDGGDICLSRQRQHNDMTSPSALSLDDRTRSDNRGRRRNLHRSSSSSWRSISFSGRGRKNRRAIAHLDTASPVVQHPQLQQQPCQPARTILVEDEDGAITYTANLLGNRPRIMDVCVPKVKANKRGEDWRRYQEELVRESDTLGSHKGSLMLSKFKELQERLNQPGEDHAGNIDGNAGVDGVVPQMNGNQNGNIDERQVQENDNNIDDQGNLLNDFGLLPLQNRPPWWNVELGAFVLNFGGRVSVASVKNFQLCDRNDQDHIMLQFGRIQGRHSFTMDFQYPLTGVQAFAIAISSLQSKISLG